MRRAKLVIQIAYQYKNKSAVSLFGRIAAIDYFSCANTNISDKLWNIMLQVSQSFNVRGRGMMTFIKNVESGLPENTILFSQERHLQWKVICRILWLHSAHAVVRFSNEKESMGHGSFNYYSNEDPVAKAIETELKSGFEYLLQPIEHSEKPLDGEYLTIKK